MAERNEAVLNRVREELRRQPDLGSGQLHTTVKEMDPSLANLTVQQFHARYVLPIKRERAGTRKPKRTRSRRGNGARQAPAADTRKPAPASQAKAKKSQTQQAGAGDRERIRAAFLEFARALAAAETRAETVRVVTEIDRYIDQAVQTGAVAPTATPRRRRSR